MRIFLIIWLFFSLGSCKNSRKEAMGRVTERKADTPMISIKGLVRDSADLRFEDSLLHYIEDLPTVKLRAAYVYDKTDGQRSIQVQIWNRPSQDDSLYWVKVLEDNGMVDVTHYNLFFDRGTRTVKVLNTLTDSLEELDPGDAVKWKRFKSN